MDNFLKMEDWERDFKWLEVRHYVKDILEIERLPDFNTILMLIGIQELGQVSEQFSREEKQDLMHIATCFLMEKEGYYKSVGRDKEGWPHFIKIKAIPDVTEEKRTEFLKEKMIDYFANLIENND